MARRFEKHQIDALNEAFEESDHLTKKKKIELVSDTGLDVEQIASWFNRKRAQKRASETREDLKQMNSELQKALQESKQREAELQKELQESKRRETELVAENQKLKHQLGIEGYNSQFDPIRMFVNGLNINQDIWH